MTCSPWATAFRNMASMTCSKVSSGMEPNISWSLLSCDVLTISTSCCRSSGLFGWTMGVQVEWLFDERRVTASALTPKRRSRTVFEETIAGSPSLLSLSLSCTPDSPTAAAPPNCASGSNEGAAPPPSAAGFTASSASDGSNGLTTASRTKIPCFCGHVKYVTSWTRPLFFPTASLSSMPTHRPVAKLVSPMNLMVPLKCATWTVWPILSTAPSTPAPVAAPSAGCPGAPPLGPAPAAAASPAAAPLIARAKMA
mmetsp:Transcript_101253/g.314954  ORF Transcript_101253/g.314954 Transcript_101253/m.314954 type:complete len:254 (+) Transcript_101253:2151-2912(+)